MAQVNWVYLDDQGGRHRVGIYHGDRTGHLMIHANMRVVQVDFSVLNSKTYSFFIEDELCEVIVEKMKNGHFGYEFRVNKTVDTPRNRIRRIDNKRTNRQLTWFVVGVVAVIALVFFGLLWYGKGQDDKRVASTAIAHNITKSNIKQLAAEGRTSSVFLRLESHEGNNTCQYYFKTADSTVIRGNFPVAATTPVILQNGFPLHPDDAFEVIYLPSDPQVHRIELFRPTRATINQYIKSALEVEKRTNPTVAEAKSLCRILTIAESQNWTALAHFIHQEQSPQQNKRYNQDSYLRLLRNPEVEKLVQDGCWNK
jgi:hypothetical protein